MSHGPRELTVEAVGADGDGLAFENGRPVEVPGALPGERVRLVVARGATSVVRLTDSP